MRLFLFFVGITAAGTWTFRQRCVWDGQGMCADLSPLIYPASGAVLGIASFVLAVLIQWLGRRALPKYFPKYLAVSVVLFFWLVCGASYRIEESLRVQLWTAVNNNDLATVKRLMGWGIIPDRSERKRTLPPLIYQAVQKRSYEVARWLLDQGANANGNEKPCEVYHPLATAYANKDKRMILLLKERGSEPVCPKSQKNLIENYGYKPEDF